MNYNSKEFYRTETHENLYDVIWKNMSYWDIVNNTTLFKEESIPFIQKDFLSYILSATTLFTGDTVYYIFVDVSSAVEEIQNHNDGKAVIPITEKFIKKYGVSRQQYIDDCSKKFIAELIFRNDPIEINLKGLHKDKS